MTTSSTQSPSSPRSLRPARDEIAHRLALSSVEAALFGDAPTPVEVDRFVVRRRLGAGGLGVVYAAHDPRLDREVALKLVRPSAGEDAQAQAQLLAEARAMARLSDPAVVTVFDAGPWAGGVYIAMEQVVGRDLRTWLRSEDPPWPQVLEVLIGAGRGLSAAHAAGLVHRDFKPDNVLVRDDGRPQVGDFGLARPLNGPAEASLAGTPRYMAPEQHRDETVGPAADQFAFCVTAYEALWGRAPHPGTSMRELALAKEEETIVAPPRSSLVPPWIFVALRRGLSAAPEARWPSMSALLSALVSDPRARRRRLVAIALVTLVVGIVLTGALFQALVFYDARTAVQR